MMLEPLDGRAENESLLVAHLVDGPADLVADREVLGLQVEQFHVHDREQNRGGRGKGNGWGTGNATAPMRYGNQRTVTSLYARRVTYRTRKYRACHPEVSRRIW